MSYKCFRLLKMVGRYATTSINNKQTKIALICNVALAQYGSSQLASITFIQGTLLNTTLFDVRSGVLFYGKRDSVTWPNIAYPEKRNT